MLPLSSVYTRLLSQKPLNAEAIVQVLNRRTSILSTSHIRTVIQKMQREKALGSRQVDLEVLNTDTMAYTNCKTRIIDLGPLKLPQDPTTPDSALRQIYTQYVQNCRHESSKSQKAIQIGFAPHTETHTPLSSITANTQNAENLAAAILSLRSGIAPPVAFPTETVYGLGADATNPASIAGIFAAKGRPSDNPLIVHVSSVDHLERCLGGSNIGSAIPLIYQDLIKEFWPGPLTILIPVPEDGKGVKFAPNVHPGQKTIGFRVPSSLHARFLMAITDRPIAAPSANSSGKPSPTTAQHVKDDLAGKINFILDGGSCDVGVESTVVDGLGEIPVILRPGGLSKSTLRKWGKQNNNIWQHIENGWETKNKKLKRKSVEKPLSNIKLRKIESGTNGMTNGHPHDSTNTNNHEETRNENSLDLSAAPRAPGMKYKHYAPQGKMFLFETSSLSPDLSTIDAKLQEILSIHAPPSSTASSSDTTANCVATSNGTSQSSTQHLTIGVLTSTSWPAHASLDEKHGKKPVQPDHNALNPQIATTNKPISTTIAITTKAHQKHHIRLETIALGKSSATISRNLFAALRTCDDLGCDYIFAEAPSRAVVLGEDTDRNGGVDVDVDVDDFETVLERMRKAASELVHM